MDSYEFQLLFGAVNYLSMYPLMLVAPWVWAKVFFVDHETAFTEENVKSIEGVFLCLLVVISPSYCMALKNKYTLFIDVSVFQRVTLVALAVITTALVGQDPFPGKNMCKVMALVDVGGGIAHALSHPKGFSGVFGGMWTLFKNTPTTPFNKSLRVEGYVGMTFGFTACVYAAVLSEIKVGIMMTLVSTFVFYLWIWFNAVDQSETPTKGLIAHRVLLVATLVYLSEVCDFSVLNIVFRLMAVSVFLAIVSPYLGAIGAGVGTLVLFKFGCDFVLTVDKGVFTDVVNGEL